VDNTLHEDYIHLTIVNAMNNSLILYHLLSKGKQTVIKGLVHPKHSVINYSPSCCSRPSFIFGTEIKIYFYEIQELSDPSIDSNVIATFKAQKGFKDPI